MTIAGITTLPLAQLLRRGEVLAGRGQAYADYPKIEKAIRSSVREDGRILVDLSGIQIVSSSYFDAALWPLWSATPELYPALTKVAAVAMDDIELVLRAHAAAVWSFSSERDRHPKMLGTLDPVLKVTLGRVVEAGEVSAADLVSADASIGATGWSNRLAALHDLRLVRRRKAGRSLIYMPAWKD
jgi:hypothetical protein